MQILDAIQLADSAQQVVELLRTYAEGVDLATALPVWWLRMPLNNTAQARQHLLGLMAIVNAASRRLDHARCAVAKQALSVFAVGLWKCEALAPKVQPQRSGPQRSEQQRSEQQRSEQPQRLAQAYESHESEQDMPSTQLLSPAPGSAS